MTSLNAEHIAEVQKLSKQECLKRSIAMLRAMKGVGNEDLSRADRIARFEDYAAMGVLDALPGIGRQDLLDTFVREYRRDVANSPLAARPDPVPAMEAETIAEVM